MASFLPDVGFLKNQVFAQHDSHRFADPHGSLAALTTAGLLRTEESMERFFRVCCEHAVQRAFTDSQTEEEAGLTRSPW